jgi:predicted small lipoprotein YifL
MVRYDVPDPGRPAAPPERRRPARRVTVRRATALRAATAALALAHALSACGDAGPVAPGPPDPPDPPFSGTVYLDSAMITGEDPTAFTGVTYVGRGDRQVYDRRVSDWITMSAYLFQAAFVDRPAAEVQVNPELGGEGPARVVAERYAREIGRLPALLRSRVDMIWIHDGTEPFGGGYRSILIHLGQGDLYASLGYLEEVLAHEAVHTSLDAAHASAPGWLVAQRADSTFISTYAEAHPAREDLAESFLAYLALRFRPDRVEASVRQVIAETIPNRLAYFDAEFGAFSHAPGGAPWAPGLARRRSGPNNSAARTQTPSAGRKAAP